MSKKVFVNCPTANFKEYALEYYINGINSLTYKEIDVILADNSKDDVYYEKIQSLSISVIKIPWYETARERIVKSRNELRRIFLEGDYEWFFSLEQDVVPPKDVIERLLSHDKKIVSGVYLNMFKTPNGLQKTPVLWASVTKEEFEKAKKDPEMVQYMKDEDIKCREDMQRRLNMHEVKDDKLIKVKACGLGCVMIHRSVMEKISFRFELEKIAFDDMYFCIDAEQQGFEIWADTSIKCRHVVSGDQWASIKK